MSDYTLSRTHSRCEEIREIYACKFINATTIVSSATIQAIRDEVAATLTRVMYYFFFPEKKSANKTAMH